MKDFYLLRFTIIFYFVGHNVCLMAGICAKRSAQKHPTAILHVSDIINGMAPIAITEDMFLAAPM